MAIKGWAPPLMGWETKGRCAAAGTSSWDKNGGSGAVNHPGHHPANGPGSGSGGFALWRVCRAFPNIFWMSQLLLAPNPPAASGWWKRVPVQIPNCPGEFNGFSTVQVTLGWEGAGVAPQGCRSWLSGRGHKIQFL